MIFASLFFAAEPMFDTPDLPRDWFGLAAWGILGLVALCAVWIYRQYKTTRDDIREVSKTAKQINAQVTNDHASNLRNDVDETKGEATAGKVAAETTLARTEDILAHMETLIREVREQRKDIGGLREEVRNDREQHHTDIARVDRRIDGIEKRR